MTAALIIGLVFLMACGVPLAAVVGAAAISCLYLFTRIPMQAVFQQLYQGVTEPSPNQGRTRLNTARPNSSSLASTRPNEWSRCSIMAA